MRPAWVRFHSVESLASILGQGLRTFQFTSFQMLSLPLLCFLFVRLFFSGVCCSWLSVCCGTRIIAGTLGTSVRDGSPETRATQEN